MKREKMRPVGGAKWLLLSSTWFGERECENQDSIFNIYIYYFLSLFGKLLCCPPFFAISPTLDLFEKLNFFFFQKGPGGGVFLKYKSKKIIGL